MVFRAGNRDAEPSREPIDVVDLSREERPASGISVQLLRVFLEDRRRIGDRIEADAHEAQVPQRRVVFRRLLDGGEMAIHEWTEIRHRTARVDEGDDNRRSFERTELPGLAV